MIHSTRFWLLAAGTLATACGDDDCEVRVLEPCPDCPSGDVLRAVEGETFIAARPDGGHVGVSCHGELVWHARDMAVEGIVRLDANRRGVYGVPIAVIGDVAFVRLQLDEVDDLYAIDREGNTRWRGALDAAGGAHISAAGESLFLLADVVKTLLGEEVPPGRMVARIDPADGRLLWWWQAPAAAVPSGIAPLADGGVIVAGFFQGSVDFGTGELLAGGEGAGFLLHLGPDSEPVWARAVTGELVSIVAVATAPDGRIAIAGRRTGAVDLGGGVVVPEGGGAFAALLGPDGTGGSGAGFGQSEDAPRRVIEAGGAAVVAGDRSPEIGEAMFIVALRDGAVVWEHADLSRHDDSLNALARTADDTVLLSVHDSATVDLDAEVTMSLGRVELNGSTTAVFEIRP